MRIMEIKDHNSVTCYNRKTKNSDEGYYSMFINLMLIIFIIWHLTLYSDVQILVQTPLYN